MKQEILENIDELKSDLIGLGDFIFDNPELGLEEYRSSKEITDFLKKNGFKVEMGIGGFETAFRAVYEVGKSGPSIGLLCEYDALEGMGHACAHHMQGPSIVGAALSIKNKLKSKEYKIVVYGTPAEETIGAKVKMLENGCFNDIDVALMMHGAPDTTTDIKSLALSNFTVKFHGIRAHAALAPEKGRSALDGIILLFADNYNIDFKKILFMCAKVSKSKGQFKEMLLVCNTETEEIDKAREISRSFNKLLWEEY